MTNDQNQEYAAQFAEKSAGEAAFDSHMAKLMDDILKLVGTEDPNQADRENVSVILKMLAKHEVNHALLEQTRVLTVALTQLIESQSALSGEEGLRFSVVIHAILNLLTRQCMLAGLPARPMYAAMAIASDCATEFYDGSVPVTENTPRQDINKLKLAAAVRNAEPVAADTEEQPA